MGNAIVLIEGRMTELEAGDGLPRSWRWLARRTGISADRLVALKNGRRAAWQESEVVRVAEILGVDASALFAGATILPDGVNIRGSGRRPRPPKEMVA